MEYEIEKMWRIHKYGKIGLVDGTENKQDDDIRIEIIKKIMSDKGEEINEEVLNEQINDICRDVVREIKIENILSKEFEENDRLAVTDVIDDIIQKIEGNQQGLIAKNSNENRIAFVEKFTIVTTKKPKAKSVKLNKKNTKTAIITDMAINEEVTSSKSDVQIIPQSALNQKSIPETSNSDISSTQQPAQSYFSSDYFGISIVESDSDAEKEDLLLKDETVYEPIVKPERKQSKNRMKQRNCRLNINIIIFLRLSQVLFSISLIAISSFLMAIIPKQAIYYLVFSIMAFFVLLATNIIEKKVNYRRVWFLVNDIIVLILMIMIITESIEYHDKLIQKDDEKFFLENLVEAEAKDSNYKHLKMILISKFQNINSSSFYNNQIVQTPSKTLQQSVQLIGSQVRTNLLNISIICFVITIHTVVIWLFKLPVFDWDH